MRIMGIEEINPYDGIEEYGIYIWDDEVVLFEKEKFLGSLKILNHKLVLPNATSDYPENGIYVLFECGEKSKTIEKNELKKSINDFLEEEGYKLENIEIYWK